MNRCLERRPVPSLARKVLPVMAAGVLAAGLAGPAAASDPASSPGEGKPVMFVQQAGGLSFDGTKLTLSDLTPTTTWFTDRPDREVGFIDTETFLKKWSEGEDSFEADNPNAVLHTSDYEPAIVELSNPVFSDGNLSYDVTLLDGAIPADAGGVVLVIDYTYLQWPG